MLLLMWNRRFIWMMAAACRIRARPPDRPGPTASRSSAITPTATRAARKPCTPRAKRGVPKTVSTGTLKRCKGESREARVFCFHSVDARAIREFPAVSPFFLLSILSTGRSSGWKLSKKKPVRLCVCVRVRCFDYASAINVRFG